MVGNYYIGFHNFYYHWILGVGVFGLTPVFLDKLKAGNTDEVYQTLPISLGAIAIVVLHELGHRVSNIHSFT
jgi:hypothetical protein